MGYLHLSKKGQKLIWNLSIQIEILIIFILFWTDLLWLFYIVANFYYIFCDLALIYV